jgi:hypothetical protein
VTFEQDAFVLAISMDAIRLIEVLARLSPQPVAVSGFPKGMSDAIGRPKQHRV